MGYEGQISGKEKVFRAALDCTDVGVVILDQLNRQVHYRNKIACKILDFIKASYEYEELSLMMMGEMEQIKESGMNCSDQSVVNCEHRSFSYRIFKIEGNQQYLVVILKDVTDQNRLEAIDEASEMMNNISYVFSGIRHEIGNPLNSMKMALTVLKNNLSKFSKDEISVYMQRMFDDAAKMEALLKSFKNFNMFEKPNTTAVDLVNFFESLTLLLGSDVRKKKIRISIDILPEAQWVLVDTRALQHVAMNILANAIDALSGVEMPTLKIRGESVGETVFLSIIDNGCGMSPELAQDAFKPFFTTKPQGTGLGLVISKKMLSQMNCGINLQSEEGVGSTVTLSMPKCRPEDRGGAESPAVYHQ
jgi:signal transduction histidine kinase